MKAWASFYLCAQRFHTCGSRREAAGVALMSVIVLAEWASELLENSLNKIRNTHQAHRSSSSANLLSSFHLPPFVILIKYLLFDASSSSKLSPLPRFILILLLCLLYCPFPWPVSILWCVGDIPVMLCVSRWWVCLRSTLRQQIRAEF